MRFEVLIPLLLALLEHLNDCKALQMQRIKAFPCDCTLKETIMFDKSHVLTHRQFCNQMSLSDLCKHELFQDLWT